MTDSNLSKTASSGPSEDSDSIGTNSFLGDKEGPEQEPVAWDDPLPRTTLDDLRSEAVEAQVGLTCGLPDLVVPMVGGRIPQYFQLDDEVYEIRKLGASSVPTPEQVRKIQGAPEPDAEGVETLPKSGQDSLVPNEGSNGEQGAESV